MDLSITSAKAIEKIAEALAEALRPDAVEGDPNVEHGVQQAATPAITHAEITTTLVQGGFVERILGETRTAATALPAEPPGVRVDKGVETANMQTFARPHAPATEPLRNADTALPTAPHSKAEFALPQFLLVPVTLIGLQVEPALGWPLPGRGFDPDLAPLHRARVRDDEHTPPLVADEPEEHEEEAAPAPTGQHENAEDSCGVVFLDEDEGAWCEELTQALRAALAAKIPPRALMLAAEQWRRGRCVVLACPQHSDPAGPAWAFVLWPRKQAARGPDGAPPPLALYRLRVEARLQWSALPSGVKWCQVRVIKEHHPRSG